MKNPIASGLKIPQSKNADKKKQLLETQEKAVIDQKQAVYEAYLDMEKQYYANLDKLKATAPTQPQTLQEECEAKLVDPRGLLSSLLADGRG